MMSTVSAIVILAVTLTAPGMPEARPDAVRTTDTAAEALDILRRADEATKTVRAVRYRARSYATGWLAERRPEVEGTAVISGSHEIHFRLARFDTTVRFPHVDGVQKLTYGADGTFYYLIDWDHKLIYDGVDRQVTGLGGRVAQQIGLREFVHEAPFSDELNGESVALLPEQRVGTERCCVVDVVYANNGGHAIWYFSKKDFLPRRVDRLLEDRAEGTAMIVVEVYDLETDPDIDSRNFALKLPDGFEKSAGFAPDPYRRPW